MTNGESNHGRDSGAQEVIEGGRKSALDLDASMVVANSTVTDQEVGKVFDLDSFSGFAKLMVDQVQKNIVSHDDALEMIDYVARYRKLTDTHGESEICAVIEADFHRVVDPPDDYAEAESQLTSFPGVPISSRSSSTNR